MTATTSFLHFNNPRTASTQAWRLLTLRLLLVGGGSLIAWWLLRTTIGVEGFPPSTVWATLALFPINVVCLIVVARLYRQRGVTLRVAMGIQRGRVFKDFLWGLVWLVVMNIPFMVAISGMVFALYGADAPEAFATIFVNPEAIGGLSPSTMLVIAVVAVVPFMVLNAPTEELVFRGFGLAGITARRGHIVAIVATSLVFGLQHIFFAATLPGMLVFFVAFTVWGLTAAIIVHIQGRLFPVIVAHSIINIALSAPAIVVPILQLTGVIPTVL